MIHIPWEDELCATACCECEQFEVRRNRIADYGYLAIISNRLAVMLMSNTHPGTINDIIFYDLDDFSFHCDHSPTHFPKYINSMKAHPDINPKLWVGEWMPFTLENMTVFDDDATEIAKAIIGNMTGFLSLSACLKIISRVGYLPLADYQRTDDRLLLKHWDSTVTLEKYLSYLT